MAGTLKDLTKHSWRVEGSQQQMGERVSIDYSDRSFFSNLLPTRGRSVAEIPPDVDEETGGGGDKQKAPLLPKELRKGVSAHISSLALDATKSVFERNQNAPDAKRVSGVATRNSYDLDAKPNAAVVGTEPFLGRPARPPDSVSHSTTLGELLRKAPL